MIKELDTVVLVSDVPEYGLKNGDIGTVVLVHREAKGFEVEFVALDGETIAVATLPAEKSALYVTVKSRTPVGLRTPKYRAFRGRYLSDRL